MKIKVCGMRNAENLRRISALDIDYVGFIFYRGSSRCVSENEDAAEMIRRCERHKVGVFVNETAANMLARAETYRLNSLQLHGEESPGTCIALREAGYGVIKAFPVAQADDFVKTEDYAACTDFFLFDTRCAGYGGSGLRFDWSLLDSYQGRTPFLLSGGLTPGSIHDLLLLKHPQFAGIDLNSGFETSPAVKDVDKLKDFIHRIRNAVAVK
ncbi:MAG: phosphoribosylanthranilate isomerase [Tannerella sp.]|jgi:phosphoribosylanthranilate isomerase|nr:phosphoribosylanthranilate isomerase [Tannerella sp.]